MAVKAIIGLDHLSQNDPNWASYVGQGLGRGGNMSAANSSVVTNGWLCARNAVSGQDYAILSLARYLVAPVQKIWFGCRVRLTAWVNQGSLVARWNSATNILFDTELNAAGGKVGGVLFLEFSYNVATGIMERRINGVPLTNMNLTSGQRDCTIELWHKASTTNMLDYRDFNVVDDQGSAEGHPTGFLGPVVAYPATLAVSEAVDWTTFPAGGSVAQAIYQPGSIPTDLVALSPLARNPLKAAITSTVPEGVEIFGIELGLGGRSDSAGATIISSKVAVGANEIPGANVSLPPSAYNYDKTIGVLQRAPNGEKWTKTSITGAVLTLQPEA